MANRTVADAQSVKGTNPQYLIEKIIRSRIYGARYWKEECFGLSCELLVDKAMALTCVGGVHGANVNPTPFLCLLLKMLQLQPQKDIIIEFIRQEDFKYVRALGATYMRLVSSSLDCYKYLEPLYNDYRKIKKMTRQSALEVIHMDEFIGELLQEDLICDVILPRIKKRHFLEDNNELDPRISALNDDIEDNESDDDYDKTMVHPSSGRLKSSKENRLEIADMHETRRSRVSPFDRDCTFRDFSKNPRHDSEHHCTRSKERKYKMHEKKHRRRARSRSSEDDDYRSKHSKRHHRHSRTYHKRY